MTQTLIPPPLASDGVADVVILGEHADLYVTHGHIDPQLALAVFMAETARVYGRTVALDVFDEAHIDQVSWRWVTVDDMGVVTWAGVDEFTPDAVPVTLWDKAGRV